MAIEAMTAYQIFVRIVTTATYHCTNELRGAIVEDAGFANFIVEKVIDHEFTGRLHRETLHEVDAAFNRLDERGQVFECVDGRHGLRTLVQA